MSLHIPVLAKELASLLRPYEGMLIVDGTMGAGGHARYILSSLNYQARVIGVDQDRDIYLRSLDCWETEAKDCIRFVHANFNDVKTIKTAASLVSIDACILDLGMSSWQVDQAHRGFSFMREGPLDMRMNTADCLEAADIIRYFSEQDLANIFFVYGQERFSRRIARAIVQQRKSRNIEHTQELVDIIKKALPRKYHAKIHPATRVFQALRIVVNDELNVLSDAVDAWIELLRPGGRIAIIAYHSLEDALVKKRFQVLAKKNKIRIVTKKPLTPLAQEIRANPRARSAKLRVAERSESC